MNKQTKKKLKRLTEKSACQLSAIIDISEKLINTSVHYNLNSRHHVNSVKLSETRILD